MAKKKKGARRSAAKKKPVKGKATKDVPATDLPAVAGPVPRGDGPTFGAEFFGALLPRMVDACPCPEDREPMCVLHLADGERLDVAEVLAVADRFALFAVFEGAGDDGVPRTEDDVGVEAVPYELVLRVSVRRTTRRSRLGFHFKREELVAATAETDEAVRKNGKGGGRRVVRRRTSTSEPAEVEPAATSS